MAFNLGKLAAIQRLTATGDVLGAGAMARPNSPIGKIMNTATDIGKTAASFGSSDAVTGARGMEGQANLGVNTDLGYKQAPEFNYDASAMGRRLKQIKTPGLGNFNF